MQQLPPRPSLPDEAYDASDPEQVAKAQAAASLKADQRRAVEVALMSTKEGREWVWQLLLDCKVWEKRISMTGEHENGFFEGQREVGLQLTRRLARSAPQRFAEMFAENDRA